MPRIYDDTALLAADASDVWETSWLSFAEANVDDPATVDAARLALSRDGQYVTGGGAAPTFSLVIA